jgi:anti-sigma regulatory factor (Ser/Thr protein kinase)
MTPAACGGVNGPGRESGRSGRGTAVDGTGKVGDAGGSAETRQDAGVSSMRMTSTPAAESPGHAARGNAVYHTYRSDLSKVRSLVMEYAIGAGLGEGRANDLVLAVSEVAANTLRHTRSEGTLAIWRDRHELICEIHDSGTITDPLAGRRRPAPDANGGHGLWLVHQVCDLVELRSDEAGTTIRMHMSLPAMAEGG